MALCGSAGFRLKIKEKKKSGEGLASGWSMSLRRKNKEKKGYLGEMELVKKKIKEY